jgi:hypothetical protein
VDEGLFAAFLFGLKAKNRAGTTGKPLVDTDHRPLVLLNLFFFERQFCGKCGVEVLFKTQRTRSPTI